VLGAALAVGAVAPARRARVRVVVQPDLGAPAWRAEKLVTLRPGTVVMILKIF
jgi:hypothetical protein